MTVPKMSESENSTPPVEDEKNVVAAAAEDMSGIVSESTAEEDVDTDRLPVG